jgi:putative DNA primase/helicase
MSFGQMLRLNGWQPDDHLTLNKLDNGYWTTTVVPAMHAEGVALQYLAGQDAWYSVCPIRADFRPVVVGPDGKPKKSRGTERDIVGLRALWTDLDIITPGLKEKGMPTMDAALDLVNVLSGYLGYRPSSIIHSGHGLHPYWRLAPEPGVTSWEPGDQLAIDAAKDRITRWGRLVQSEAIKLGGVVDSVHDLARVLRVPGTTNTKKAKA